MQESSEKMSIADLALLIARSAAARRALRSTSAAQTELAGDPLDVPHFLNHS
jgi:hypothetical protein